jgi:hypothetical protein
LPGTNTLAYLASSSAKKKKSFLTLTPGFNVIKQLGPNVVKVLKPQFTHVCNKLEGLSLAGLFGVV